ncbi:hypothetical protein UA08_08710 [Talaromyces atroroseus]|uniref:Homeobox domain-containing protein n=1 Tax=Talaromyces atroroseus TaxID=1441469 RepID=A0A225ARF7_TALAT|nr:hypothetical protein UA08_08710 [Talaromyces atroroseus]OKL56037.1 hypothetical protein UA08_08710 [Talaromyces atroroseus]
MSLSGSMVLTLHPSHAPTAIDIASRFETVSPVFSNLHGLAEDVDEVGIQVEENAKAMEPDNDRRESKQLLRKGARTLKAWFYQHQEYPYPNEAEKEELSKETGLSVKRVSTWFANARRRQKQKQKSAAPPTEIFRFGSPMPSMTPMERWQATPPEDEAVPQSTIEKAIPTNGSGPCMSTFSNSFNDFDYLLDLDDDSSHLDSSAASLGGKYSEASSDSFSSAWSHHSSGDNGLSFSSLPKRPRPRPKRGRRKSTSEGAYQCTFCTQSFNKKNDWCRHEKSVHISLESWICSPDLQDLQPSAPALAECKFCDTKGPSRTHWETHDFNVCADTPIAERSFTRKDYLWQHLKKFHACTKLPVAKLEDWRCQGNNITSRCGFCETTFPTWSTRMDHLAGHFKQGARMSQWTGDWGMEPAVMARLRNAVLPAERSFIVFPD